jgi:hypothetical protein
MRGGVGGFRPTKNPQKPRAKHDNCRSLARLGLGQRLSVRACARACVRACESTLGGGSALPTSSPQRRRALAYVNPSNALS